MALHAPEVLPPYVPAPEVPLVQPRAQVPQGDFSTSSRVQEVLQRRVEAHPMWVVRFSSSWVQGVRGQHRPEAQGVPEELSLLRVALVELPQQLLPVVRVAHLSGQLGLGVRPAPRGRRETVAL